MANSLDTQISTLLKVIDSLQEENESLKQKIAALDRLGSEDGKEVWAWFLGRSLKQRACALAYAQGVPVEKIGELIQASESTVRLHLRGCRTGLGVNADTKTVISAVSELIATTSDLEFVSKFGIHKSWYKKPDAELLEKLITKTSTLS